MIGVTSAAAARERIVPERQKRSHSPGFEPFGIRGSRDAINSHPTSDRPFPSLHDLWLGADCGVLVHRLRKQKLGERTRVRFEPIRA
jgi:hypothetical protein